MGRRTTTTTVARTLADALRAWDGEQLTALLLARPDLARPPVPAHLGGLAARAATRSSVALAVDRLDTLHVAVVEALALLPGPVTAPAVRRLVRADPAQVAAALGRLRRLALLWGDDSDLRLVRAVHEVVGPTPAGLGPSVRTLVAATGPARVLALAEDLGLIPATDPVGALDPASRVADAYADPAWVREQIAEAGLAAWDVPATLARLAAGPPGTRVDPLPGQLRVDGAVGAVEHLVARGLLAPLDARTVTLPREVGLVLRGGRTTSERVDQPPQPDSRPVPGGSADEAGAAVAYDVVRRVEQLLAALAGAPVAVLRSGGVGIRDVRVLAAVLSVPEQEAGLLLEVAAAAMLLGVGDGSEQVWLPTEDYDEWRTQSTADRWAVLVAAWLATDRATALVGDRDEQDRPVNPLAPGLDRGAAASVRRATLQVLADAGEGRTVDDVDQLVAAVAWARPRRAVLRERTARRTVVEAAALGVTGRGALTRAGRALLAAPDRVASRLAPLLPVPVDHVLLQADLTAVAPGPLEPEVAHGIGLLADVESQGGATVYRFSADSVRRALDAGWTAADVHAFLRARSRTPVPQALTYLVDDGARRHGRLRVGAAGGYVRVDDPAELDAVLADGSLSRLGLRRVAPTVALTDQPPDVVLDRLRRARLAPMLERADGEPVQPVGPRRRAQPGPPLSPAPSASVGAGEVVAAVLAGERAGGTGAGLAAGPVSATRPGQLVEELQHAVEDGRSVWLSYLDETGRVSDQVVEPVRVHGGRLTAFDRRSSRTRDFTLHRISHVSDRHG